MSGRRIVRLGGLTLAVLAGGLAHPARAQDPKPATAPQGQLEGKITDVRPSEEYGVSVLVDLGTQHGVAPGQTVELRRDGKSIGYGSIDTAFSDVSVATVGTIVTGASPLRVGDQVIVKGAGFQRPHPSKPPAQPPAPEPLLPRGTVAEVREHVVLLDIGRDQGVELGMEVVVLDAEGAERGRLQVELLNHKTAGGLLLSGDAARGDRVAVIDRPGRQDGPIDFVALSFLGVVADLEHPTPHRAPCHVGVPVRRVLPGSPAQRAGIGRADRVIAIDDWVVRDVTNIRERIEARSGDRVRVAVLRGDRIVTLEVVFR